MFLSTKRGYGVVCLLLLLVSGVRAGVGQTEFSQHLKPDDARDLQRLTATSAEQLLTFQRTASPLSIQQSAVMTMVPPDPTKSSAESLYFLWHQISLDTTSTDHAPLLSASPGSFHEQYGPHRTARALGLVHLAMFEAVNGIREKGEMPFESSLQVEASLHKKDDLDLAAEASVIEAAYGSLVWLYPGLAHVALVNPQQGPNATAAPGVATSNAPSQCYQPTANFSLDYYYICSLNALKARAATLAHGAESMADGRAYGRAVVEKLILVRQGDGSNSVEPTYGVDFVPTLTQDGNGKYPISQWQVDPVSKLNVALGGNWANVKPMSFDLGSSLRLPEDESAVERYGLRRFAVTSWPSYFAVKQYAVEPRLTPASATGGVSAPRDGAASFNDLYYIAKFWAYDGTAGLCAPARLYNEVADAYLAEVVNKNHKMSLAAEARYYALVNLAMMDASIVAWDGKFHYQIARPVTAIRGEKTDLNAGKLPAALGTKMAVGLTASVARPLSLSAEVEGGDPSGVAPAPLNPMQAAGRELWYPIGAQITNSAQAYNITPPFPAYPSGHAVFGGAVFGVLRQFASPTSFDFQSDEFNGVNRDVYNFYRCVDGDAKNMAFCENGGGKKRTMTLDCAERENADSRVWMGVHWMFDADDGIVLGNRVAQSVFSKLLLPTDKDARKEAKAKGEIDKFDDFAEKTSLRKVMPLNPSMQKELSKDQRVKLVCPDLKNDLSQFDAPFTMIEASYQFDFTKFAAAKP